MGEVTDYATFRLSREVEDLQQRVTDLTGLVAGLMAVLCDRQIVDDDEIIEMRLAGELAADSGPMLGQPFDELAQSAAGYALAYRDGPEGGTPFDGVQAAYEEICRECETKAG